MMKINCLVTLASDKFNFSEYLNDLQLKLDRNKRSSELIFTFEKKERKMNILLSIFLVVFVAGKVFQS